MAAKFNSVWINELTWEEVAEYLKQDDMVIFLTSICLAIDSALTVLQQLKVLISTNPKNPYIVSNDKYW